MVHSSEIKKEKRKNIMILETNSYRYNIGMHKPQDETQIRKNKLLLNKKTHLDMFITSIYQNKEQEVKDPETGLDYCGNLK